MNLYYLDYLAVSGRSWLHHVPAWVKLLTLLIIIGVVLTLQRWPLSAVVLAGMLALAISARLPLRTFIALTVYPLIFLLLLFLSVKHLTVGTAIPLLLRVLAITASVILVLLTTSYPAIFKALGRVLPGELVTTLFFTYRALFILSTSFDNARTALHLRGGIDWLHPVNTLKNLGTALAHVLVHAIELSQRMAENLVVRGFQNRIYHLGRKA